MRTVKRVIAAAMRSIAECAASDNMPREPVRIPVRNLSSVMAAAASTEESAAERLASLRCCSSRFMPCVVVPGVMGVRIHAGSCFLGAIKTRRVEEVALPGGGGEAGFGEHL